MTTRKARADRAEGAFKPAQQGKAAVADHHAAAEAVREKTARLRAQRLAKEEANSKVETKLPPEASALPGSKRGRG